MPDATPNAVDVAGWVRKAEADPIAYQQRQTIEVTLNAIAMTGSLNVVMILKGGILMGLAYNSPRQTVSDQTHMCLSRRY